MDLDAAMRPYFRDGRLVTIPRKRPARLALLDLLANQFEPGQRYSEKTVDSVLGRYHPDYCALRRYLVDEGFLERWAGAYWRAGGTFEVG